TGSGSRRAAGRGAAHAADCPRPEAAAAAVRPRPPLLFTFCYGAGLATGLLRFGTPFGALLICALLLGLMQLGAPLLLGGAPSRGGRLRTLLGQASRSLYGARAPLVDALMLGRRGGIDADLQDRFAQSGLVHLLSISGFHVGLIGAWVFLIARLVGARRETAL